MPPEPNLQAICTSFATGHYHLTKHGTEELWNDNISIDVVEWCFAKDEPEVIEAYLDDPKGASCLVLMWDTTGNPIHIVVGYDGERPDLVTAYRPDVHPDLWDNGFWERR